MMLRVIRPEAGECRKSVDLRQEKGGALLLNAIAFFDLPALFKEPTGEDRRSSTWRFFSSNQHKKIPSVCPKFPKKNAVSQLQSKKSEGFFFSSRF
jgi:hypothetical protein